MSGYPNKVYQNFQTIFLTGEIIAIFSVHTSSRVVACSCETRKESFMNTTKF